jgi:hypothetical protein
MASLNNKVFDDGLNTLTTDTDQINICSAEPTTYAQATSTYSLGAETSPSVASPTDKSGGGREVIVAAISGANVTGTGTATHYALVDTATSTLLAAGSLSGSQAVTSGDTFSLTSFAIGIPDPV